MKASFFEKIMSNQFGNNTPLMMCWIPELVSTSFVVMVASAVPELRSVRVKLGVIVVTVIDLPVNCVVSICPAVKSVVKYLPGNGGTLGRIWYFAISVICAKVGVVEALRVVRKV